MTKIIGNTTATPNPRPDWLQDDPNKADYIKNKPNISSGNGEYSIIDGKYFIIDDYRYGDLGLVYGAQWREQGDKQIDQIKNIIEMLKNNIFKTGF